jgi:hypothetical protein
MNYPVYKKISRKKISPKTPYWNFWKVVFAGWLIRYPKQTLRVIGVPLGFLLVMIYNALAK